MDDSSDLRRRHEKWQRERALLPWADKVKLAEAVRESIARLRRQSPGSEEPQPASPDKMA